MPKTSLLLNSDAPICQNDLHFLMTIITRLSQAEAASWLIIQLSNEIQDVNIHSCTFVQIEDFYKNLVLVNFRKMNTFMMNSREKDLLMLEKLLKEK